MAGGYFYDNHERVIEQILAEKGEPRCTLENWDYDTPKYSVEGSIAYIHLADARSGNGITPKTTAALFDIAMHLYKHPAIKVAVFTASGAYFCTGGAFALQDPEQAQYENEVDMNKNAWEAGRDGNNDLAWLIYLLNCLPQYKVAAIRGENMGAGNSIIASMDYVIAPEEKCKMHFMEVKRGVASCMTWQGTLSKIGGCQMRRFALVGDILSAQEAMEAGLVQEVHGNNAQANERAIEFGKEIAKKSQVDITAMKNSGPQAKFPLMKMPTAIREGCAELQDSNPDFEAVTKEVIEDCGRTGRPAALRLSQELWPHKAVHFVKCGQQMMRITLARKSAGNLINQAMLDGLLDAAVELHKSIGRVRLVEVRAQGDAFCEGLDKDLSEDNEQVQQMLFLFSMLPMPVLGIVEGRVSGLGTALCSTFDLLAAHSQQAKFSFAGLSAEKSGLFVSNRLREKKAAELLEKKAVLSAVEARQAKLATEVFSSKQDLDAIVTMIAEKVSLTGPNGVAVQKFFVQKLCTEPMTMERMLFLSGHISTRQVDPEFGDAIAGIMDKSHKPRYCKTDEDVVKPFGW